MNLPAIRSLTDPDVLTQGYRDLETIQHPEVLKDKLRQAAILYNSFNAAFAAMQPIIGKMLDVVQRSRVWEEWGYQTFNDFMTRGMETQYGIKRTDAYYCWRLMKNWPELDTFTANEIGTTKLRELARISSDSNQDKWLEKAKSLSVQDFKDEVSSHMGTTSEMLKLKRVEFAVRQETLDLWEETVAQVIRRTGTTDWNVIIEALCGEWASK